MFEVDVKNLMEKGRGGGRRRRGPARVWGSDVFVTKKQKKLPRIVNRYPKLY